MGGGGGSTSESRSDVTDNRIAAQELDNIIQAQGLTNSNVTINDGQFVADVAELSFGKVAEILGIGLDTVNDVITTSQITSRGVISDGLDFSRSGLDFARETTDTAIRQNSALVEDFMKSEGEKLLTLGLVGLVVVSGIYFVVKK